jgi:hypothetical protein
MTTILRGPIELLPALIFDYFTALVCSKVFFNRKLSYYFHRIVMIIREKKIIYHPGSDQHNIITI